MSKIRYATTAEVRAAMQGIIDAVEDPFIEECILHTARGEGLVLSVYRCPAGKRTIGWGHNLDANPVVGITDSSTITMAQANDLLIRDWMAAAETTARTFPNLTTVPDTDRIRVAAIIDMVFNMGVSKVLGFRNMCAALRRNDWPSVAREAADSAWYQQVGIRARRVIHQLTTGLWPEF